MSASPARASLACTNLDANARLLALIPNKPAAASIQVIAEDEASIANPGSQASAVASSVGRTRGSAR